MPHALLLVEENELIGRALVRLLSQSYRVSWSRSADTAQRVIGQVRIDVLVCASSEGSESFTLLRAAAERSPRTMRVVYGHSATPAPSLVELAAGAAEEPDDVLPLLRQLISRRG